MPDSSNDCHPVARSAALRAGDNVIGAFVRGHEIALWRGANGTAQAWDNRCPHRSVRFSLGQVIGDRLSCAYHGWQYAIGSGDCVGIPSHPDRMPPKTVRATPHAVAEAVDMVWVCLSGEMPQPHLVELPPDWTFCRSLAVRASYGAVVQALSEGCWKQDAMAWNGKLGDVGCRALLLDAKPGMAVLHLWVDARAGSRQMRHAHAAARRFRGDVESAPE